MTPVLTSKKMRASAARHLFEGNGKRCDICFALREDENHVQEMAEDLPAGAPGPDAEAS